KNIFAGEQCDILGGNDSAACNGSGADAVACHTPRCGDGYHNAAAGEGCDNGDADTITCNGSTALPAAVRCQFAECGDGHVNLQAGETCDPGTGTDTNLCNGQNAGAASCHTAGCGDGYTNTKEGESCDTGGVDTVQCNSRGGGMT